MSRDFRSMKLEILQDNKTTQARVGTVMSVPSAKGKKWVQKGYARDLSHGDDAPVVIEEEKVEPPVVVDEPAEEPKPNNND